MDRRFFLGSAIAASVVRPSAPIKASTDYKVMTDYRFKNVEVTETLVFPDPESFSSYSGFATLEPYNAL